MWLSTAAKEVRFLLIWYPDFDRVPVPGPLDIVPIEFTGASPQLNARSR